MDLFKKFSSSFWSEEVSEKLIKLTTKDRNRKRICVGVDEL